jgi:membrane-associated phospholipid phosphatase
VVVRRLALPAPKDAPDFGVWVLAALYGRDPTVNCLPSTHCAMAIYAAVAIARVDRRLAVWAVVSAVLIGASTLFTQEHYFLDVITGYLLGGAAAFIVHAEQPAL